MTYENGVNLAALAMPLGFATIVPTSGTVPDASRYFGARAMLARHYMVKIMSTQSTRATLATYCGRIARNKDAAFTDSLTDPTIDEKDNRVFLELADTFALAAQASIRTTELMLHLAALGTAGHETALLSFAALHKKDAAACEKAVKAFALCRNKMVNPKQKSHDANVEKIWGNTSIRMSKAGIPELYEPKKRNGNGTSQHKVKRTEAHARAIIRAWNYRCELRAAQQALKTASRKPAARKPAARKPASRAA